MKKITVLFLVISLITCMAINLTGCEKISDYETFISALTKTNQLKTYDCDIYMKVLANITGSPWDIIVQGNVKVDKRTENIKILSEYEYPFIFTEIIFKDRTYYENGFSYNYFEKKIKAEISLSDLKKEAEIDFLEFKEDDIVEASFKNENDVNIYIVKVYDDKVSEFLSEQMNILNKTVIKDIDDVTFSNVNVVTKIKDGYIIEQNLKFNAILKLEMPILATSSTVVHDASMEIDMTIKINNPGTVVTVTAPSDLSEYKTSGK